MQILITNINNNLINDAINLTHADKALLILNRKLELDTDTPYQVECLDSADPEKISTRIRDLLKGALEEGEVELALEADALGLEILESAKTYEIFKKKNIFVIHNGKIEKFKACLC
jgi:hypothetical protein